MDMLRKTLAVFCAILFVITGVMALFLFNFDQRAFTAETYRQAFAREDFYNKIPAVMAEAISPSTADQSQFPIVIQGMDRQGWESFFRALLPPQTLQAIGDDVLNSSFAYLNMQTNSVAINLTPLKASMMGEAGVQVILSLLETLPACSIEQITQMSFNLFGNGQIEFCNPPADLQPLLIPVIQSQMELTALIIPDQVPLIAAPPLNDPRPRLQTMRLFMRLSLILPIGFLFLLTIFAVRSLKDWLTWWGTPLLVTGGSAAVIGLLGAPIVRTILEGILVNRMPDYLPVILLGFAGEFASAIVSALLNPVTWQGLLLAFVGFVMALIGFFIQPRNPRMV